VVDGVAASVYIDFLGTETAAHRSAAKYRLLARFAPRLTRWLHARGLNQPLLLFMASALPKVSSVRHTRLHVCVTIHHAKPVGSCQLSAQADLRVVCRSVR